MGHWSSKYQKRRLSPSLFSQHGNNNNNKYKRESTDAHHLAQVLVRLGLVAAPLVRRHLLPLGGELPAPLARVHVRRVLPVEALAGEVVPLAAALALYVVLLPGVVCRKDFF